ncbi:hypothetical protein PENTCL1PPCAC_8858, partial [Pristionchus entomophagus]
MCMTEMTNLMVRLKKSRRPKRGDDSPDTNCSEREWLSPEDMADDLELESILPSRAIAADERMIDSLLEVAERSDPEIAMAAFRVLMMVPQNGKKLSELEESMQEEGRLQALLERTSDPRFLYYILMMEAIILPAGNQCADMQQAATNAMLMFVRVVPQIGQLGTLMSRSMEFRSLVLISITRILHLASMTATRVIVQTRYSSNQQLASLMQSISDVDLPIKWSKHIRTRRLSTAYSAHLLLRVGAELELVELIQTRCRLIRDVLCGVILSASS